LAVTLREIEDLYGREVAEIESGRAPGATPEFCPTLPDGTPDWWKLLLERSLRRVH
jgi:hypothetical protein